MHHQEFEPPEALRDLIKCFWYARPNVGEHPSTFDVVPDGYAELIFHFGSPCQIFCQGDWQTLPSPFLVGLLRQPVLFHAENGLEIIGVRCFPWTVYPLFNLTSGPGGVRVVAHPVAQLHAALEPAVRAGRVEEAIAQLTPYFLATRPPAATDRTLLKAGTAMQEARGTLPVGQVAVAADATVRTLERKFKQAAGYTVKDVSGLMRFEQVRNQLWQHPDTNLAGLAYDLGYTDQAHLSREFKRYSGTTPAAFARGIRAEAGSDGNDFVAFVQA